MINAHPQNPSENNNSADNSARPIVPVVPASTAVSSANSSQPENAQTTSPNKTSDLGQQTKTGTSVSSTDFANESVAKPPSFATPISTHTTAAARPFTSNQSSTPMDTVPSAGTGVTPSQPVGGTPGNDVSSTSAIYKSDTAKASYKKNAFGGWKGIAGAVVLLLMIVGGGAAYYLQTQSQDNRQQAAYYDNGALGSGLSVTITSQPNSSADSYYKPASSDINDASRYYNQAAGDTVEFAVPVRNLQDKPLSDKHQLVVFKIDKAIVDGREIDVTQDSAYSEQEIYDIHKQNDFKGTKQTFKYATGWTDFTVNPGEQKLVFGSWKPGPDDCGMYQLDMQLDTAPEDKIVGVGMIRVKNCAQPTPTPGASVIPLGGQVVCKGTSNGQNYSYPVVNAKIKINDKVFTTNTSGNFSANELTLNTLAYVRMLPAEQGSDLAYINGGNQVRLTQGSYSVVAENGCVESFRNANCGGIHTDVSSACFMSGNVAGYEWCTLNSTSGTSNFDFTLTGCVAPPTPSPTTPPTNSPAPSLSPTPQPTAPVGAMCLGLCGAVDSTDFGNCADMAIRGTPTIGSTVNLRCDFSPKEGSVKIFMSKNGSETQLPVTLSSVDATRKIYTASYQVTEAASYGARCVFDGLIQPVTPFPTQPLPTSIPCSAPNTCQMSYDCPRTNQVLSNACGLNQVCCQPIVNPTSTPGVNPTATPIPTRNCASIPGAACTGSRSCPTGNRINATGCDTGLVCCGVPTSDM